MTTYNVIVFGSSYMAEEYLKVLKVMDCVTLVVGRNGEKACNLADKYSCKGSGGGTGTLRNLECSKIDLAIIASSIDSLKDIAIACINKGVKNILIEKPGALNNKELSEIKNHITNEVKISVAYNRRYYNSVIQLKQKLDENSGPVGCFFDFTDRETDVLDNPKSKEVVKRWGFANASHVIDTAFYLVGSPEEINSLQSGFWNCHPTGNVFAGSGRTEKCLFSYFATWNGGGRWDIEISANEGRYKLSPLEELQFCKKNQFSWEKVPLLDSDDSKFKPGLYKMVKAVLYGDHSKLPSIDDHIKFCAVIDKIFGYEE